ncbi:alginate export family protein [Rheinheimera sp.]|uniref:alginate export family protein n=1 Tax=Rheinheimera sp. TaxID=1869214 RepID=UPI00307F9B21
MMQSPHYPAFVVAGLILLPGVALAAESFSSFGLEIRQKLQSVHHTDFSAEHNTLWLQRWLPSFELGLMPSTSLLLEPVVAFDSPHSTGTSPQEQTAPELHRLILQTSYGSWQLQLGRQVWAFGNQRQLGKREGTNIRRRFDGLLLTRQQEASNYSLYHGQHVIEKPGSWDDQSSENWRVSGMVLQTEWTSERQLSLHYLRYLDHRDNKDEVRHSMEFNIKAQNHYHGFELEHIYQWGHQQQYSIDAYWAFARYQQSLNQSFSWSAALSLASGDRTPHNQQLSTFQPLFAKAPFYSEAGIIATSNIKNLQLGLHAQTSSGLRFELEYQWLARLTSHDAIYSQGRSVLLSSATKGNSKLADVVTVRLSQEFSPALEFEILLSHLNATTTMAQSSTKQHSLFFEAGFTLHY